MMTKVFKNPVFQPKHGFKNAPLSATMIMAGILSSPAAYAVIEFKLGDIEGTFDSQLSMGVTVRAEDQNSRLYSPQNGALRGMSTTGTAKSNTIDDGNLNFNKGDIVSNVFKGIHGLELKKDNFGAFVRFKYWYDFELKNSSVRHGNTTTGYAAEGQKIKLDDSKFDDLAKFSGVELLDAFIYGEFDVGDMPLDLRLGRQVVNWGESTFILGGINQINPIDVAAFRRPGATLKEALMPVGLAFASLGVTDNFTVEAFYQYEWQPYALDGCGTFFMTSDIVPPGCTGVNLLSDATALGADGTFTDWNPGAGDDFLSNELNVAIRRGGDEKAKDTGQYGIAGRYYADNIETEFGAYFMTYHARKPYFSVRRSVNDSQDSSNNVTPTYQLAYPEDLKLYGLSFNTNLGGTSVGAEITYQPDLPVGWNSTEGLHSFLIAEGDPAASPLASYVAPDFLNRVTNTAAGESILLADEYDVYQIQSTVIHFWDQAMGASRVTLVAEVGATVTDDIDENTTDLNTNRYGRGIVFGNCNIHGLSDAEVACERGGFVTKFAWGYRAKVKAVYNDVFAGVNLTPAVTWKDDVNGVTPNGNFNEGKQSVAIALGADYGGVYSASISYTDFLTSRFDAGQDRDHFSLTVGMSF